MGLEDDDKPVFGPAVFCGFQGNADLRGMMPVIVNHRNPRFFTLDLKASRQSSQISQAPFDIRQPHLQFKADSNGRQGPGEPGVSGVTLTLTGAGADGEFGTGDDPAPQTDTTDAYGNYLFDDLPAGQYVVTVDASNFDPAAVLDGYSQPGDPDHFALSVDVRFGS